MQKNAVYFIFDRNTNMIKIGISNDLKSRFQPLQRRHGKSLELIGFHEGDVDTEKGLHKQFEAHRREGEWFDAVNDIFQYVGNHTHLDHSQLEIHELTPATLPDGLTLYNTKEAAAYLGISLSDMKYHVSVMKHLRGMMVGKSMAFTREQLDEFKAAKRPAGRPRKAAPVPD